MYNVLCAGPRPCPRPCPCSRTLAAAQDALAGATSMLAERDRALAAERAERSELLSQMEDIKVGAAPSGAGGGGPSSGPSLRAVPQGQGGQAAHDGDHGERRV